MNTPRKQYAVLGLGKFGSSIATTLAEAGFEVIAVDQDEERVQDMSDIVTLAVRADITEPDVLKSIGVNNVDAVVVAITNMEASIMGTILAKEAGVEFVLTKGMSELHGTILKKVGADEVVYPEKAMGARVAKKLMNDKFLDLYELSDTFSLADVLIPQSWIGKTLQELSIREKYGVTAVGIRLDEKVEPNVNPHKPLPANAMLYLVGNNKDLENITRME